MRKLLFLLILCAGASFAQCSLQTINVNDPKSTGPTKINGNFTSINNCKVGGTGTTGKIAKFSGTIAIADGAAADIVALFSGCSGVLYLGADGACHAPGGGGGSGTVTVVGAGNLISTACVTGGGSQALQTPNANCTIDSSGNIKTSGTIESGVGSTDPGMQVLLPATVATLPTCNSGSAGGRASVTDATATTFLSIVAGSGSNKVPVFCDGAAWRIG